MEGKSCLTKPIAFCNKMAGSMDEWRAANILHFARLSKLSLEQRPHKQNYEECTG